MDSEVDYDELGNILSSQGRSYSYDKDFRLTEIVSAEATINYESYDAAGRLERRTYDPALRASPIKRRRSAMTIRARPLR